MNRYLALGLILSFSVVIVGAAYADVPAPPPLPLYPSGGAVAGTVISQVTGQPVEGARVLVQGVFQAPFPPQATSAISDAKGAYRTPGLPPGEYKVLCSHARANYEHPGLVRLADLQTATVNIVLPRPAPPPPPLPSVKPTADGSPPADPLAQWLPCKIIQTELDGNELIAQLVLKLNENPNVKRKVRIGQDGVVLMFAEGRQLMENGDFKIIKIIDPTRAVARLPARRFIAKNNRCLINTTGP